MRMWRIHGLGRNPDRQIRDGPSDARIAELVTSFEKRKFHLGYRQAILKHGALGFPAGTKLRGHEFHYTTIIKEADQPLAQVLDADGNPVPETGAVSGHVTGTFFHMISRVP